MKDVSYKQVGGGAVAGGSVVALLLAMFQQQGVGIVSTKYQADLQVVLERSISNSERINRLEGRITKGFDELKDKIEKVGDLVSASGSDRWTKEDHHSYARRVDNRFERIENKISTMDNRLTNEEKKK